MIIVGRRYWNKRRFNSFYLLSMKLQIDFPTGAYSNNKIEIKKIFNILGYKYSFSESKSLNSEKLKCVWKRDKQKIIAIFNGSGKESSFTIECNDSEKQIFESFTYYNGIVKEYSEPMYDEDKLKIEATRLIEVWWTPIQPEYKEPLYFFTQRLQKQLASKRDWIQWQINKMKEVL